MTEDQVVQKNLAGPKPIAIQVSSIDIQMLYACRTDPHTYGQLLLAKLKDVGGPVEWSPQGLRLAHGQLFKMKDSVLEAQDEFTYLWLPDAYVAGMTSQTPGQA